MPGNENSRKLPVRPDRLDFRDLPFRPNIALAPPPELFPAHPLPIKDQKATSACTGFALSTVVEHLLIRAGREQAPQISPYMLYSMARRYDEFPGSRDEGSSLRGALKGWHKHGACCDKLWQTGVKMPPAPQDPAQDWWLDAVNCPLGAYYRIDKGQITDIHAALNEVQIVYASADTHAGWDGGDKIKASGKRPTSFRDGIFTLPPRRGGAGGHAFAIVGYNERGFLIQNSWGAGWGSHGYAILTYEDWLENAMDCWVAQLGVVTREHRAISASSTLRTDTRGHVALAGGVILRNREISPFVVNLGNNGELSNSGLFRTTPDDLRALVDIHLAAARRRWELGSGPIDVCIYAHGGLVGEKDAAEAAAEWIPLLYEQRIFPVFLMWETDLMSTVLNRIEDAVRDVPRPAGAGAGFWSRAERWWNARLERVLAQPGSLLWGEMKDNALKISRHRKSGAVRLYAALNGSVSRHQPIRFHLVGHSAGSIVHSHLIDALAGDLEFESVSFLAPAVRVDTFDTLVRPRLLDGTVRRYQQIHLTDKAEQEDPSCGPYRRSLLYLVSESFEGGAQTPILGMEKYFDPALAKQDNVTVHVAPGRASASTTHGGFDNDGATRRRVLEFIRPA
jgi:hypothetical protein